ncbi:MAG: hypothetical protein PHS84_10500 [Paludibacter sp.]|nr:hypothetical protein [Paludibacter sp.]
MNFKSMKKGNLIILIIALIAIVGLIIAVFYFNNKVKEKDAEMSEVVAMMNFDKEQVEREYTDLNSELDGYTSDIHNDSLVKLLQDQKAKVQELLEELRITKSTNAVRISQLKKELATVRMVMIQYVNQIDSLNTLNKNLKTENVEVHRKFQAATATVQQLSKEKDNLSQVVNRASIMEVTNFSMEPLNSKNKKTTWFSQTATLKFNYTVAKNITAEPGEKTIYLRITKPDDELLIKSPNNVFPYENKNIGYSLTKTFEYTGDALNDVLYWKVNEILPKGTYRVDFFIDGNRVGTFPFLFEK